MLKAMERSFPQDVVEMEHAARCSDTDSPAASSTASSEELLHLVTPPAAEPDALDVVDGLVEGADEFLFGRWF